MPLLRVHLTPSRTSVRNTVPEVYTKAIFPDLIIAVANLPETPRTTGAVTKTVARKYLAEAYLTYAWWLENPKNIPTYPECSRVDPDGHDAAWYFQQAYDIAVEAIQNPGPYGLCETFYDLTTYANERNKEMLLWADHTADSELFNGAADQPSSNRSSYGWANGTTPDNFAGWMSAWNYPNMQMSDAEGNSIAPVQREAIQPLGRPWTRMAPTIDAIENFTDKDKDSRYDASFTTVFHGNWHYGANADVEYVVGNDGNPIQKGGIILRFLDEEPSTAINYPSSNKNDKSKVGAGTLAGYSEYVIGPEGISRLRYPILYKIGMGPMNTVDANGNRQLGSPNGMNSRPYYIAKFSELYLIAAEAAVKGASTKSGYSARELVNVLRARAGKWTHKVNGDNEYCEELAVPEDHSAELVAATPATITIDYILDERMREYFGEGLRWFDLTRTQTWAEKAGTYRIGGSSQTSHTPETVTRNIPADYYLRPIPQATIDAFEMSEEERVAYQNPAYRN